MKTIAEIGAEIGQMEQQIDALQKAKKQCECDLLEAQLFEETGLRIGDNCYYAPHEHFPDIMYVYEVCIHRYGVPFIYLKYNNRRAHIRDSKNGKSYFSQLQKIPQ